MKSYIPVFAILSVFYCQSSSAQKKTSLLDMITNEIEERLSPQKEQNNNYPPKKPGVVKPNDSSLGDNEVIEIPVVFHVVLKQKPSPYLIRYEFQRNINLLNHAFNKTDAAYINTEYRDRIGTANIKFILADEKYKHEGIQAFTYYDTDKENFRFVDIEGNTSNGFYDDTLKKHGYIDSKKILNIWICNLDNGLAFGYSSFPQEKNERNDGVVISFNAFFSPIEDTRRFAMAHEVGHYLGLRHIWSNCSSVGDLVPDTPPQGNRNTLEKVMNGNVETVCNKPWEISNYQNYMDYVGQYGMFTKGQVKRMREQIRLYRSGFLNGKVFSLETNTNTGNPTIISTSNTPTNTNAEGEVCFSNSNPYSRKIFLTNIKTGSSTSIVVGPAPYSKKTVRCAYNLEVGIYNCRIYTTFSNTPTEEFQLKIPPSSQEIKLAKDGFN